MMKFDVVVIGAGPAGMSASTMLASQGAKVALLDEQPKPGGQIYRNIEDAPDHLKEILGPDYASGKNLTSELQNQKFTYLAATKVWQISPEGKVSFSTDGTANQIEAKYILLATGALERPVPVHGWTLPGVMTAGAAQILMKTSGLVSKSAILAGSGPLIYLLAAQMVAAGAPPQAIVETQTLGNHLRALRHLKGAIKGHKALLKGMGLLIALRKAGVRRFTGVDAFEILGDKKVSGIRFSKSNRSHELSCDEVLLHQGVVPNTQFSRALRLDHSWSDQQQCFQPITDNWGRSSQENIFIAGDGSGIGGAKAAESAGQISAAELLHCLNQITRQQRDELVKPAINGLAKELAIRPFLDTLYAVPDYIRRPNDDVMICRCEEVTAGDVRKYAKLGCTGPNQTKVFSRSGMGPCQGRYCGATVTEILAQSHELHPQEIGAYRIRMPIKPVTLGEVASLKSDNSRQRQET